MATVALHELLDRSARDYPDNVAIEEPAAHEAGREITYAQLSAFTDRLRDLLREIGVRPGDRVGIYLRKSIDAVVSIFGILKTGACYVPVDPTAPTARNAYILNNCSVRVVILERRFESQLRAELQALGPLPSLLVLEGTVGGVPLGAAPDREAVPRTAGSVSASPAPDDLAYILYTSGSTGKPKGVMLSHRNAVSYVEWCSETFQPSATDRFSSHAPFHFDLSILDIYVPLKHGATLVLIAEDVGKDPVRLGALIAERRLSVWYSAPSILSLLTQYGGLDKYDWPALRLVLFAGEVFPVKHLRALQELLPKPRYFNLYGPTETNVCTFYEVPAKIPPPRTEPFPIGRPCSHLRTKVVDSDGGLVFRGEEGELCVAGSGVMSGYWNLPGPTADAFRLDESGDRWYRTGDIVREDVDGNYVFIGRRDRMVKRRGYRVELGEIESGLYRHAAIKEAAVIALPDEEAGVRVTAFLSCRDVKRPSIVELKRFCAENLPQYMIPDLFVFVDALPKTSTDKIDYQQLKVAP